MSIFSAMRTVAAKMSFCSSLVPKKYENSSLRHDTLQRKRIMVQFMTRSTNSLVFTISLYKITKLE